jgi:ribonuclease HII
MRYLGLDEAGRGCVLGPLVIGAFVTTLEDGEVLRRAGAADSKILSPARRAAARLALQDLGEGRIREIPPSRIDEGNINLLEQEAMIALIDELRPDAVWIDAPVHPRGVSKFRAGLESALSSRGCPLPSFIIEPKADHTYPVVGAASIWAKLHRDAAIAELGPVGSGYPSDPVTRAWLRGFIERQEPFPPCVRTRWGTIDQLRQQSLFL